MDYERGGRITITGPFAIEREVPDKLSVAELADSFTCWMTSKTHRPSLAIPCV